MLVDLSSIDQMIDTPTNNFCTLNSITATPSTLSEGNLKTYTSSIGSLGVGTIPMTAGKWYAEVYCVSGASPRIGIFNVGTDSTPNNLGGTSDGWCVLNLPTRKYHSGSSSSYGSFTLGAGEIVGIAYDADNGKIWFSKNGVFVGTVDSSGEAYSGISGQITWAIGDGNNGSTQILNAGQDSSFAGSKTRQNNTDANGYGDFYYTPPSGYLALCTQNLASELTIPIDKSNDYFDTTLHTGNNGNGRTFTGLNFKPDLIWGKVYDSSNYYYMMVDSSRGGDRFLASNATAAEDLKSHGEITSWNSDGTTWVNGTNASYPRVYYNDGPGSSLGGSKYTWWQWKINGGTTSTNTNGTITTTVQANQDAGISILTYTGNGSNATIGHGLSKAPEVMIGKIRNEGYYGWGGNWWTYKNTGQLQLNSTSGYYENAVYWQNTNPTNTVITMGGQVECNRGGSFTQVAYCFHSVEGFSKFGQYVGNGSTNGVFIYTGFKPAFVIYKMVTGGNHWFQQDNKRPSDQNPVDSNLYVNLVNAEVTNTPTAGLVVDFVSNGIKIRGSGAEANQNGQTYVYMCFAENPFVTSTGVAGTAK